jgi:hypothetical protein
MKPVSHLLHWHVPGSCRCRSSCWAMLHASMFLQPARYARHTVNSMAHGLIDYISEAQRDDDRI